MRKQIVRLCVIFLLSFVMFICISINVEADEFNVEKHGTYTEQYQSAFLDKTLKSKTTTEHLIELLIMNEKEALEFIAFRGILIPNELNDRQITLIEDHAFYENNGLNYITFYTDVPPTIDHFIDVSELTIYVPTSLLNIYRSAIGWVNYSEIITELPIN